MLTCGFTTWWISPAYPCNPCCSGHELGSQRCGQDCAWISQSLGGGWAGVGVGPGGGAQNRSWLSSLGCPWWRTQDQSHSPLTGRLCSWQPTVWSQIVGDTFSVGSWQPWPLYLRRRTTCSNFLWHGVNGFCMWGDRGSGGWSDGDIFAWVIERGLGWSVSQRQLIWWTLADAFVEFLTRLLRNKSPGGC